MNTEKIDLEQAILIAISGDRYLLNKAVDEGFEPELMRSSPGRIVATTLMSLRDQGVTTIDALLLKTQIEERGMATPQVTEYLEKLTRFRPPPLVQMMSYLELLKDRSSRERLVELASRIQAYASQRETTNKPVVEFMADALQMEQRMGLLPTARTPTGTDSAVTLREYLEIPPRVWGRETSRNFLDNFGEFHSMSE